MRLAGNDYDNRVKGLWYNVLGKLGATLHPIQILCSLFRVQKWTSFLSEAPSEGAEIKDGAGGRGRSRLTRKRLWQAGSKTAVNDLSFLVFTPCDSLLTNRT